MEMWAEIRRKVFVEGASKRSIRRDYGVSARTLEKILTNAEPPLYRQSIPRPKPVLGRFLGVIEEILLADRDAGRVGLRACLEGRCRAALRRHLDGLRAH
jgi:hypothetical protein